MVENYYLVVFQIFAVNLVINSTMAVYFFRRNMAKQMECHLMQMRLLDLQQQSQYLQVQGVFDAQQRRRRKRDL